MLNKIASILEITAFDLQRYIDRTGCQCWEVGRAVQDMNDILNMLREEVDDEQSATQGRDND
jgi:hypothetical protein